MYSMFVDCVFININASLWKVSFYCYIFIAVYHWHIPFFYVRTYMYTEMSIRKPKSSHISITVTCLCLPIYWSTWSICSWIFSKKNIWYDMRRMFIHFYVKSSCSSSYFYDFVIVGNSLMFFEWEQMCFLLDMGEI